MSSDMSGITCAPDSRARVREPAPGRERSAQRARRGGDARLHVRRRDRRRPRLCAGARRGLFLRTAGDDRLDRRDRHRRQRRRAAADGSRARHLAAQHGRRAGLRADVHPEADRARARVRRDRDRGPDRPRGPALHLQAPVPWAAAVRARVPALGAGRRPDRSRPCSSAWCCRCRRSGKARASRGRWHRRSRSSEAAWSRRCCCCSSSASSPLPSA